ncbi:MAG TPA: hypothetical protein PKV80_29340, partial [Leptospiraceae bacterium]|nr:hypothetical protein [Leptospiraceae bacterium]
GKSYGKKDSVFFPPFQKPSPSSVLLRSSAYFCRLLPSVEQIRSEKQVHSNAVFQPKVKNMKKIRASEYFSGRYIQDKI